MDQVVELELIAEGGGAIYINPETGRVHKRLLENKPVEVSRLKREYEIMKSLCDVESVVNVYEYNSVLNEYTMEKADKTLFNVITNDSLSNDKKFQYITEILDTMDCVHKRNKLHRDLHPSNIFLINDKIKIADFGLGKDLSALHSHKTQYTNGLGQIQYCSPEQINGLKDATKQIDVFSLGKIINFIMTGSQQNATHVLRSASEKATNQEISRRHSDAGELLSAVKSCIRLATDETMTKNILKSIEMGCYTEDVSSYLSQMNIDRVYKHIISGTEGFEAALLNYMKEGDNQAESITENLYDHINSRRVEFITIDMVSNLMYSVLKDSEFNYVTKEFAAKQLRYNAVAVNRFHAQDLIKVLIDSGIEPLIEEILKGN